MRRVDLGDVRAVLLDDPQERLVVSLVAVERPHDRGDARGLDVRLAGQDGGDGAGVVAPGVRVVRQTAAHQQRPDVGVAQPERPEVVRVVGDPLGRVRGVVDDDLLRQDGRLDRLLVRRHVQLARLVAQLHEVERRQVAGGVVE